MRLRGKGRNSLIMFEPLAAPHGFVSIYMLLFETYLHSIPLISIWEPRIRFQSEV